MRAARGQLLESSAKNIRALLAGAPSDLYRRVVDELIAAGQWAELNDRFYKTLAFGTGGLRGRTIGKIVTRAERGNRAQRIRPEFPCVGTNAMNFYNISRATQGLVAYLANGRHRRRELHFRRNQSWSSRTTRAFSQKNLPTWRRKSRRKMAATRLSSTGRVRRRNFHLPFDICAPARACITASHNPPHDNGYKVYFSDGAQVVEPHASGIIAKGERDHERNVHAAAERSTRNCDYARRGRSMKLTCGGSKR